MKRRLAAGLLAIAAAAALALWATRERVRTPERVAEPTPPPEQTPPAPAAPPEERHPEVSPAPRPRREPRASAAPPPPPEPYLSLDDLLRLPQTSGPQSSEPRARPPAGAQAPARRERRIRIDFSQEEPLADAPLPRAWRRTEAGVSLPMDEAERLRVRGGVRVDERGAEEASREVEATPSLGLEFRF